ATARTRRGKGVKAGGKYNLLPLDAIPVLDARLARPLQLPLQRPQLRSHPYLQGLHLLFRASCLGQVQGQGQEARLVVDPVQLAAWRGLNATERYFTLFEAWLLVAQPEMVGMRGDRRDCFLDEWALPLRVLLEHGGKSERQRLPQIFLDRDDALY